MNVNGDMKNSCFSIGLPLFRRWSFASRYGITNIFKANQNMKNLINRDFCMASEDGYWQNNQCLIHFEYIKFFRNKNFPMLINITIRKADHSMSDSLSLRTISSFI